MRNLPFLIWMLGFPPVWALVDVLGVMAGDLPSSAYPEGVRAASALISFAIWGGVGCLLYERRR